MQSNVELPAQGADEGALQDLMAACSVADHGLSPSKVPAGVLQPSFLLLLYVVGLYLKSVLITCSVH